MAVTGLNRDETCIVHHDRSAAARCGTCHKPVCSQCVVSTSEGKFCSHECAQKAADFRARYRTTKGAGSAGKLVRAIIWIIVVVIVLGLINRFVFAIPVVGPYLDKISFFARQSAPANQTP